MKEKKYTWDDLELMSGLYYEFGGSARCIIQERPENQWVAFAAALSAASIEKQKENHHLPSPLFFMCNISGGDCARCPVVIRGEISCRDKSSVYNELKTEYYRYRATASFKAPRDNTELCRLYEKLRGIFMSIYEEESARSGYRGEEEGEMR